MFKMELLYLRAAAAGTRLCNRFQNVTCKMELSCENTFSIKGQ
jgi:hypothetical protein